MYLVSFVVLVLLLIFNIFDKYNWVLYVKLFLVSFLYFYYANYADKSMLVLVFMFMFLYLLIEITYKILKKNKPMKEDNTLYNMAHEVKNPLSVVKGYLEMFDINDKEKSEKYLRIIKSEIDRSIGILDDTLSIKKVTVNKEMMDLSLLITDIKETISYVYNDVKIIIPSMDEELIMLGDYDKLKQVIINMIKNSVEAGANKIEVNVVVKNKKVILKIIDNGSGITDTDLKKVGELFFTTKVNGNGIGVNLSKKIVKLHDGKLSYESVLNKGTTAIIELPLKYKY